MQIWMSITGKTCKVLLLLLSVLGVVRWRQLPAELRFVVGAIWFGLVIETTSFLRPHNNLWLAPLDAAGEFCLLSLVYARALEWPRFTRLQPWVAGAFVLYAGGRGIIFPEATRFKTDVLITESLLLLGMAGLYFHKLLNELRVPQLGQDAMFWVSAGLLLYSLCKLLILLFSNYMLEHYSQQLSYTVWTIHALLNAVLYLCYGRALWMRPQK
jgi:hypothetical protein